MSVTYTNENEAILDRPLDSEAPYIPAYARSRKSARKNKGGIKTWMILAPIGVLALGGIGAAMVMGGEQASTVEAEATTPAPLAAIQPVPTDVAAAPMTTAATPAPIEAAPTPAPAPAPAPVIRRAAPAREAAPVRRAAPRASTPVAPQVQAEPALTGPRPYSTAPSATATTPTSTLNRAPVVATPAPATPASAPVIVVQPAN